MNRRRNVKRLKQLLHDLRVCPLFVLTRIILCRSLARGTYTPTESRAVEISMEKCRSLPGRVVPSTGGKEDAGRSLSMERLKETSLGAGMDRGESSTSLKPPSIEREVKVVVLGPVGVGKSGKLMNANSSKL